VGIKILMDTNLIIFKQYKTLSRLEKGFRTSQNITFPVVTELTEEEDLSFYRVRTFVFAKIRWMRVCSAKKTQVLLSTNIIWQNLL
jgi:hypothetical protein